MKNTVQAIILAAGKSTRFNTKKTKLAETICGQPMLLFSTRLLQSLEIKTTVIVGYEQETIKNLLSSYHGNEITYVEQQQQLGTGHALACSQHVWDKENILIINGDMPLVTHSTIIDLYTKHQENNAIVSFVTSCTTDKSTNNAYGRVIITNNTIEIVEAKDLTGDQANICCINAGIYLIKKEFLVNYITTLKNNNANNEFYITDLIKIASENNKQVITVKAPFDTIRGINTIEELFTAEQVKQTELIKNWMNKGVRFSSLQNIRIDLDVTIEQNSFIGEGVHLLGKTSIGEDSRIEQFCCLENTHVDKNVHILPFCIIKNSSIASGAEVGPFAHLRDNVTIGSNASIGNFVEIKNSEIGKQTKAKHLTYIGDATIGSYVNIGAGTITCNYDGINKHKTIIKNDAFIGSNNTLIAPITIGENAFTGAGSTITNNVPDNALAIARARQENKLDYTHKLYLKHHFQKQPLLKKENTDNMSSDFSFIGARLVNHDIPTEEQ